MTGGKEIEEEWYHILEWIPGRLKEDKGSEEIRRQYLLCAGIEEEK
ncbi:MAG: hypothetical protein VW455_12930 [Nitrospinota bacterium]